MGESIVQVTEGSGKKLHTWQRTIGANSVEDEIVLLGENYFPTYNAFFTGNNASTAASHMCQIMAGASLKVRIRRIEVYQSVAATTAALMDLRVKRLTTAGTGGTAITPSPHETADGASGATAMQLPTVKGTEGVTVRVGTMYLIQTVAASMPHLQPALVWDFDRLRTKGLVIPAGTTNGICVTNLAAHAVSQFSVNIVFDELSF